jgi:hypothetical protein
MLCRTDTVFCALVDVVPRIAADDTHERPWKLSVIKQKKHFFNKIGRAKQPFVRIQDLLATNPPRVDYELTERGKTLILPLHLLWAWAQTNRTAIEGARRDFEQQRSKDWATA